MLYEDAKRRKKLGYPVPEPLSDMPAVVKRVMTGDQEGQKVNYD